MSDAFHATAYNWFTPVLFHRLDYKSQQTARCIGVWYICKKYIQLNVAVNLQQATAEANNLAAVAKAKDAYDKAMEQVRSLMLHNLFSVNNNTMSVICSDATIDYWQ